jgi:DNA (cytosine-5)-methyltransferase 1
MRELVAVDLFSGAGGTSTGLSQACAEAGLRLDLTALNHWDRAIETHAANHPDARHICESLDGIDPRKLFSKIDLLVASPECVNHSRAKGGKPLDDQSRATPWHVTRWAEALQPTAILVENVPEFARWGPLDARRRPVRSREGETFRAWLAAVKSLGYRVSHQVLNSADYGDPTTRQRLFVLAVRGRSAPPWPAPTHAENPGGELFGRGLRRWRPAREVIDWGLKGQSIFTRKRPLKENTLARIEAGLRRFGGEAFMIPYRGEREGQTPRTHGTADPMPTLTTEPGHALLEPFLLTMREGVERRVHSLSDPLDTVTAGGKIHALVEPFLMQMSQTGSNGSRMRPASQPMPTVTTADDFAFVVSYYGTGGPKDPADPLDTVTARDRFALLQVLRSNGIDVLFRMLQPHELAAAHSFPAGYSFKGTRSDQVRQIGNSVPVSIARSLCRALIQGRR